KKESADKGGLLGRAFSALERGLGIGGPSAPEEPEPVLGALREEAEELSAFDAEVQLFSDDGDRYSDLAADEDEAVDFEGAFAPEPAARPAPALEQRRTARKQAPAGPKDPAGELARTQSADGSFGGEVGRTAAALVALLLDGHTRRKGNRRRAVMKAAAWLQRHAAEPLAALALELLAQAEAGGALQREARWSPLYLQGPEGAILRDMG
ncbi:MAG: hypothetical protein H6740_11115, partial [Alphaproteobacteria bacterium]|nr:hypothetical protein [Alphaproteobacteria bacterium]